MKIYYKILTLFFSIFLIISLFAFAWYRTVGTTVQDITYTIEPGQSLKQMAFDLKNHGVITAPWTFILLTRLSGHATDLQAGEYFFAGNSSLVDIIQQVVRGDVVMHELRINEGWTFAQVAEQILAHDAMKKTLDWSKPNTILTQLSFSEENSEGLFYPDTYYFPRGYTDATFLTHAYTRMQEFLEKSWQLRDNNLPYDTSYQALIAASIIEKETAVSDERTEISGVIMRRLQKNMPLQMDPTVVYGLGANYDKPLTHADLKTDTPYNTYLHYGLPPTPIAIPSPASIEAALHPRPGTSLYFVANGDGSHTFSSTLDAHNQAVEIYRKQN